MTTDHLANERTYLAYLRTALAFVAFGFVIARFALFEREISVVAHIAVGVTPLSTIFGTAMAVAGVAVAAYGTIRYVRVKSAIVDKQVAPMPSGAAVAGGVIMTAIGALVAFALLAYR